MNKARENQRPKYVAVVVGEGRQFGTESCVEEVHYKEVQRCAKERSPAIGHLQDRSVAMKVKFVTQIWQNVASFNKKQSNNYSNTCLAMPRVNRTAHVVSFSKIDRVREF